MISRSFGRKKETEGLTAMYKELWHFLSCGGGVILFGAWLVHRGISLDACRGGRIYVLAGFSVMACMVLAAFQFMNKSY